MHPLRLLFQLVDVIRKESSPHHLSLGFVAGMCISVTPAWTLHWAILLLSVILTRINVLSFLLGLAICSPLGPECDPLFHRMGLYILTEMTWLTPLWNQLSEWPLIPFTRFNNSIVMGSGVTMLILAPVIYFTVSVLLRRYQDLVHRRLRTTYFIQTLMGTRLYRHYSRYRELQNG